MIFKDYFSFYVGTLVLVSAVLISISRINLPGQNQVLRNLPLAYLLLFASSATLFVRLVFLYWKEKLPFRKIISLFFLTTLPASIVLFIGTNWFGNFHYIFPIASFFNLLFFLNYLIFLRLKRLKREPFSSLQKEPEENRKKLSPKLVWLILSFIIIARLGFGFYQLGNDYYSDEGLWFFERIEKYWKNIAEGDLINTRPSDKPGITVSLISGAGLIWEDPAYFDSGKKHIDELPRFFVHMRLPILIFSTLAIWLFYWLIKKLTSPKLGLAGAIFIGLSPILLGITRLVNPDALLWIFIPLSLLSYLAFLMRQKTNHQWPLLLISGITLGLGLLTKYVTNFLIVFMLPTIFYFALDETYSAKKFHSFLKDQLINYLTWLGIGITVFSLLFPGVWLKPERIFLGTFGSQAFSGTGLIFLSILVIISIETFQFKNQILFPLFKFLTSKKNWFDRFVLAGSFAIVLILCASVYFGKPQVNFESILSSPKSAYRENNFFQLHLATFLPLLFGTGVLTLIGIFASLLSSLFKKTSSREKSLLILLWLFIHTYFLGSLFSSVVPNLRYQITLAPIILVIALFGWKKITSSGKKKFSPIKKTVWVIFFGTIFFEGLLNLWSIKPYYFSFNNPLLPKTMVINPKDMGEGNFEVAQWLNHQPGAEKFSLWSDRTGICKFFIGHCNDTREIKKILPEIPQYNYYVISSGRKNYYSNLIKQRLKKVPAYVPRIDHLYNPKLKPVFVFSPAQRPQAQYIKIIDARDVVIDK